MENMLILAQATDGSGVFAWGGVVAIVFLLLALLASVFWIWMLIDCLTSNMPTNEKLLWGLVILFLHLLGAIIYFVVARKGSRGTAV